MVFKLMHVVTIGVVYMLKVGVAYTAVKLNNLDPDQLDLQPLWNYAANPDQP